MASHEHKLKARIKNPAQYVMHIINLKYKKKKKQLNLHIVRWKSLENEVMDKSKQCQGHLSNNLHLHLMRKADALICICLTTN